MDFKVASEAALLFSASFPDFANELDSNPKLLVCSNGVLDFTSGVPEFRQGRPEDVTSFSTNITYDTSLTWQDPDVRDVLRFFRDLFPVEDTYRYALDMFSRTLIGRTEELFFVLSGSGVSHSNLPILLKLTFCTVERQIAAHPVNAAMFGRLCHRRAGQPAHGQKEQEL